MIDEYASDSKMRIYVRVINHFRRQWFAIIYETIQDFSQGPFFFWVPGLAMYRSSSKKQEKKEVSTSGIWSMLGHPVVLFMYIGSLTLVSGIIGLFPVNTISKIIFVVGTIISLWGLVLGALDYRSFRRIKSLNNSPSPQSAAKAFQYLSAHQPEIRYNALGLINHVSEGTPGKVLKQSNRDTSAVVELLVQSLQSKNDTERQFAATAIRNYSRDYAPLFQPFARKLASFVDYPDSIVQIGMVIALGNIGQAVTDQPIPYVKAISSAAKDEDPDVRQAAAFALGKLKCHASEQVLHHLSADTAPDVRSQAVQSQQSIGLQ